jgi:hypothetical protein
MPADFWEPPPAQQDPSRQAAKDDREQSSNLDASRRDHDVNYDVRFDAQPEEIPQEIKEEINTEGSER